MNSASRPAVRQDGVAPVDLEPVVRKVVASQLVFDLHTHLYPPAFGSPVSARRHAPDPSGLMLWGIDELVTYHYLVAEFFRAVPREVLSYDTFWRMPRREQADHVWKSLFVDRTPLSEACRGVLTSLQMLGLDPNESTLDGYRRFFAEQPPDQQIDRVMTLANVSSITMTNNVFDYNERRRWLADPKVGSDQRFKGVLRIDPLVCDFASAARRLREWDYQVSEAGDDQSIEAARRFLREWVQRVNALYIAISLPPEFEYLDADASPRGSPSWALREIVVPVCREQNLPLALMIGVKRGVNPLLREAGDASGAGDVGSICRLCAEHPDLRLLVTMLARENQHELCVAARKFANLMVFGCWWFLNIPSLIDEIERMRLELLGSSFIPQHSDARVLEQLLYKWSHSRTVLSRVLVDKYRDLAATGFVVTRGHIERDVRLLLAQNAVEFLRR